MNMSHKILKGKKGIIFGALDDFSIAWKTAEAVKQAGGDFVLTNAPVALRMGKINKLAKITDSQIFPADATNLDDLNKLVEFTLKHFNSKLDFILHSIGMSINVRKGKHYTDLNYDWMSKGSDVSAVSFHKLMQTLYKSDAMNKWGSIIALSYIAAQRIFPNYNDMADNKALLESIARSFGYFFGKSKQVRVNTISQSPTITTAGKGVKGFNEFLSFSDKLSPLGNASSEDCANYIVAMFSDYTKKVTLQNLYNDGGYSSVGVSQEILDIMKDRTE
jgi:enoyl-[acyl-carrier protein] reductase I